MAKRKPNCKHEGFSHSANLSCPRDDDAPKLTLGVELPPDPRAGWADDDDTTGVGPVDDLQPIGRVTPVPCAARYENNPDTAEDPCEDCGRDQRKHEMLEPLREADEEPTLLGPFHEPPLPSEWRDGPMGQQLGNALRVEFIDATAIALYARGFPLQNVYAKAAALWEQRQKEGFK